MKLTRLFLSLFLILIASVTEAQEFNPATSVKAKTGYIEFLPGNMPLVISIPHDGYLTPDEIPERQCINCGKNRDIYTHEIGMGIRKAMYEINGCYPYIIINNLHRTRLDPNRNIAEAATGNPIAELAWNEYHNFIDSAISEVEKKFGKGLYIDLHGHRHQIERIELGYLLSSEELQLDDELLDYGTFKEYSSLRNLIDHNINSLSFSELIRGDLSLGHLFELKGYPTVPGPGQPFPKPGEPYFSGGFDTYTHGSSSGGTVDGIQIELGLRLRSDEERRGQLSYDIATVLTEFLKLHYFPDFPATN